MHNPVPPDTSGWHRKSPPFRVHDIATILKRRPHSAVPITATVHRSLIRRRRRKHTLMLNSINHPDARGMSIFADALMELFPR